jgi:AraC-like DNA-binding protein
MAVIPAVQHRLAGLHVDTSGLPPRNGASPLTSGTARSGWVRAFPQVLRELGGDPARLLGQAGITTSLLEGDDSAIPFQAIGRLFQQAIAATGCGHVALLVGARFEPSALGDVATLMANAPTVGAALRTLILHFHLLDEGAVPMLLPVTSGRATLAHSVYARDVPALDQFADLAAAIAVGILQRLCGPSWRALRVTLPHRPPADPEAYRRVLGTSIEYDAPLTTIVFAASWLEQPLAGGRIGQDAPLAATGAWHPAGQAPPLAHLVRRALRPMVFTGTADEAAVARLFSLHPRALRRQLRAEGETFQGLLNGTRFDVARQLLRDTELRVAGIAAALHYADISAFTRAFRAQAGIAPAAWRQRKRAAISAAP